MFVLLYKMRNLSHKVNDTQTQSLCFVMIYLLFKTLINFWSVLISMLNHNRLIGLYLWVLNWLLCLQGSFPARYNLHNSSQDSCCLDSNYQAFLLVDDGSLGRRGGEATFMANLENFISLQKTGTGGATSFPELIY